jgi:hypothetical protein
MSYKKFAQDLYAVASQLDALGKLGLADRVDGVANKIISLAAPIASGDDVEALVKRYFAEYFHHDADRLKKDMGYRASDKRLVSGDTLKSLEAFLDTSPASLRSKVREGIEEGLRRRNINPKAYTSGDAGRSAIKEVSKSIKTVKPSPAGIGHMTKGKAAAIIAAVGVAAAAIAGYFMQNSNDSERLNTEMQALKVIVERAADKDDAAVNRIADYGLLKAKDIRSKIGKEPGYEAAPEQMQALRSLEKGLVEVKGDIAMD